MSDVIGYFVQLYIQSVVSVWMSVSIFSPLKEPNETNKHNLKLKHAKHPSVKIKFILSQTFILWQLNLKSCFIVQCITCCCCICWSKHRTSVFMCRRTSLTLSSSHRNSTVQESCDLQEVDLTACNVYRKVENKSSAYKSLPDNTEEHTQDISVSRGFPCKVWLLLSYLREKLQQLCCKISFILHFW